MIRKFSAILSVDEQMLRDETSGDIDPLEELIFQEVHWLDMSGIYIDSLKEIEDWKTNKTT